MNKTINLLPEGYIEQLLALNDELKLFIINRLSASLLSEKEKENMTHSIEKKNTNEWIRSLSVKGGESVPADVNDIQSLLNAKYI